MQLHIHTTKYGDIIRTVLIKDSKHYETNKSVIWEGEYAQIQGKIYSLDCYNYIDHKVTDEFIYKLEEIEPIRDLDFMLNNME